MLERAWAFGADMADDVDRQARRRTGPRPAEPDEAQPSLDAISAAPIPGTGFLEVQGRHPAGSLEDLKLRFTRRVIFLARRWRNRINDELRKTGHSHARWTTLIWVHLIGGTANHRELAERIGVELPTLIRLLNRFETEGLVERRALASGRRAKTACLTPAGMKVLAELNEIAERARAAFLDGADIDKLEISMSLFNDLLALQGED